MDFLRAVKRRSLLSEAIYILLNIGLAAAILLVVWAIESPVPAFALILLSKWRVFAVRPRYWFAHLQANLVDLIVSLSLVVLLYAAGSGVASETAMVLQILMTILYVLWLLVLKPQTRRAAVVAQAGVAVFVGVTALYTVAFEWPSSLVVVAMWVLGYATARHVMAAYSEPHLAFLSFAWGLLIAELGWLAYHWTIAYNLPFATGLRLPQVAIVALALSFLGERAYGSFSRHGVVRAMDVALPALLSLSIIAILLILFNGVSSGNI
jgi:hypothetical protein